VLTVLTQHTYTYTYTKTVQHEACKNWWRCPDFAATVQALVQYGPDVELSITGRYPSTRGWQPLHFIAANARHAGAAAALELLVTEHGVDADCLTDTTVFRSAAWLVAHSCSSDSSIAMNSSSGSNSSSNSSQDTTEYAIECLEQLLQLGADLHATGSCGLLCAAASSGNTRVAQLLFAKGLQLDETDPEYLPLQHAARKGHTAMV
jgi:Ankyrin repeats (many copies)